MLAIVRNVIIIFVIGFIVLFLLRLGYGYWQLPNGEIQSQDFVPQNFRGSWDFAAGVKNYASKKYKRRSVSPAPPSGGADQKYEKVANVGLKTRAFDDDEKRVRELIKTNSALIQFEQRRGLEGRRVLQLAIGVDPERFDDFVDKIQTYGKLTALTVNKSDKTNEYRELIAKRSALEKTREALTALKQREGQIKSMIELEQQILSLEQQIQGLGVNLGDFDSENEFVTVKVLLAEAGKAVIRNISIVQRMLVAFVWTAKYYTFTWLGFAAALISALVAVHLGRLAYRLAAAMDSTPAK